MLVLTALPILADAALRFPQRNAALAYRILQSHFELVFDLGAMIAFPRLEHQIRQLSRMAAKRQRHDMIKLIFAGALEWDALLSHELELHAIRI